MYRKAIYIFTISLAFFFIILQWERPAQADSPCSLRIMVLNDLGNIEEGARVLLYHNKSDYQASKNPVRAAEVTDHKGIVKFKKLKAKAYFVDVRKGNKNNDGAGAQTAKLEAGKANRVTIIIE